MNERRSSRSGSLGAAVMVVALSGGWMACGAESPPLHSSNEKAAAAVEEPADERTVQVVDLAGLESILDAHNGHGFLLNFWATWCLPCVQELPELDEIARRWRPKGGRVLTVSYDLMVGGTAENKADSVRSFLDEHGYSFGAMILDEPDYDAINERLDLPGPVPVTLAVDAHGNIVDRQEGMADAERFDELMRHALGQD